MTDIAVKIDEVLGLIGEIKLILSHHRSTLGEHSVILNRHTALLELQERKLNQMSARPTWLMKPKPLDSSPGTVGHGRSPKVEELRG